MDLDLERLAVKEIIEEIERNKRLELESRVPPQRHTRPNKRFLGRTIVSVLQHNRRQHAEERRNSNRKLRELDRKRRRSRSRSTEHRPYRKMPPQTYHEVEPEQPPFQEDMQMDMAMFFLNNINQLIGSKKDKVPKKRKKKKKTEMLTIDLTKRRKQAKKKKIKQKAKKKKTKSKKRRRRKENSSSSSSSSPSSSSSGSASDHSDNDSERDSNDGAESSTLLIDLT